MADYVTFWEQIQAIFARGMFNFSMNHLISLSQRHAYLIDGHRRLDCVEDLEHTLTWRFLKNLGPLDSTRFWTKLLAP